MSCFLAGTKPSATFRRTEPRPSLDKDMAARTPAKAVLVRRLAAQYVFFFIGSDALAAFEWDDPIVLDSSEFWRAIVVF